MALAGSAAAYTVPDIEPVYGAVVSGQTLTVRVAGACTKKSDLTVAVGKNPPRPLILIARKHPGGCQTAAGQAEIVYRLEDLGLKSGEPFSLANPLVGEP
ncbi:MAG: hypothetical protein WDN45_12035 [Caulobacteraceae bacterium]